MQSQQSLGHTRSSNLNEIGALYFAPLCVLKQTMITSCVDETENRVLLHSHRLVLNASESELITLIRILLEFIGDRVEDDNVVWLLPILY